MSHLQGNTVNHTKIRRISLRADVYQFRISPKTHIERGRNLEEIRVDLNKRVDAGREAPLCKS